MPPLLNDQKRRCEKRRKPYATGETLILLQAGNRAGSRSHRPARRRHAPACQCERMLARRLQSWSSCARPRLAPQWRPQKEPGQQMGRRLDGRQYRNRWYPCRWLRPRRAYQKSSTDTASVDKRYAAGSSRSAESAACAGQCLPRKVWNRHLPQEKEYYRPCYDSLPNMTVADDERTPPVPCASAILASGTWRGPHSPRTWRVASINRKMPYMPGWQ